MREIVTSFGDGLSRRDVLHILRHPFPISPKKIQMFLE